MNNAPSTPALRQPKQERSRRSFERVQDAALALLVERGPDGFTLAEVCTRADASMGAIYNRVDGKDDLIRLIHNREMLRIDRDAEETVRELTDIRSGRLAETVAQVVNAVTMLLRRNADVLRPFMLMAATDNQISARGRLSYQLTRAAFIDLLAEHGSEIQHSDPARAMEWCFTIIYSVVGRRLGLGSTLEGAEDDGSWDEVVANLTDMLTAYLSLVR